MHRRNLQSYLEDLPPRGSRPLYLWRDGVRWRRRSYVEVYRRSLSCAARLTGAGLRPGGSVLIQGPEAADWIEALHGIIRSGGVAVPLSPDAPEEFRRKAAAKVEARFLIAPASMNPPTGVERIDLGSWPDDPPGEVPVADRGPDDAAEIIFTSGTTGDPKGVVLTHGNLVSDLAPIEAGFRRYAPALKPLGTLKVLTTVPLSHMFGQVLGAFLMPYMGLTATITPPRPREVFQAARRHGAWGLVTVPRVLDLIAAELRREVGREWDPEAFEQRRERFRDRSFLLQSLVFHRVRRSFGWRFRFIVVGGAAMPAALMRFYEDIGFLVAQGYGLTETAPVVAVSNPFRRGTTSVGKPLRGQEVKIGPDGEIWVRGPNISPGYLGGEGETVSGDGWFRTGDIGEVDPDGRLRIRGRVKDVIVTPEGENVHATDVEDAFDGIPGVREACVIGLPTDGGDEVHAVLLADKEADPAGAVRRANTRLQAKQRIRGHTVWPDDDFPRTGTGKIRKVAVIEAVDALRRDAGTRGKVVVGGRDLRAVVAHVARVEPESIEEGTSLAEGLGLKSLDLVELAAAVEEEFGMTLPEEGLEAATFGDLKRLVEAAGRTSTEPSRPLRAPKTDPRLQAGGEPVAAEPTGPLPPAGNVEAGAAVEEETWSTSAREKGWRGRLNMPRWAATAPIHLFRRCVEEAALYPLVAIHSRTRQEGRDNLQGLEPPFLVVANHRSYLDTVLVKRCLPFRLRGPVAPAMTTRYHRCAFGEVAGSFWRYAKERFQAIILQIFFNAWPLPETAGFRVSLDYAGELADRGFSPLVFPEGVHVEEGKMKPFREGIGLFARDLRCPILPVYLEGTATVLPEGARWFRFGRTRVVFGRPFTVAADAGGEEATRRVEESIRALAPKSVYR